MGKNILITGAAGFIGANLALELFKRGVKKIDSIIGIDNMNSYYDVRLKEYRLEQIEKKAGSSIKWVFINEDISDYDGVKRIFLKYEPDIVVNLAAQAGVRYSIENPSSYIKSNVIGFYNILEGCKNSYDNNKKGVEHLVYASSSSVYGLNEKIPYSVEDKTDRPVSLYAATKKSNELMAFSYSKLYDIPSTGLRFFTVYGPAGRPDMAYFGFTNKLMNGEKIKIYNYGKSMRDFTYIDDIVEGLIRVIYNPPFRKKGADGLPIAPHKVYNIGNGKPVNLLEFVEILQEELLNAKVLPKDYDFNSRKELVGMQAGDVPITYADMEDFEREFSYKAKTDLRTGLKKFANWYYDFYIR